MADPRPKRLPRLTDEQVAQAHDLYERSRLSIRVTAVKIGRSYGVVRRALLRAGVQLRGQGTRPWHPKGENRG